MLFVQKKIVNVHVKILLVFILHLGFGFYCPNWVVMSQISANNGHQRMCTGREIL